MGEFAHHARRLTTVLVVLKALCVAFICAGLGLGGWLCWFYVHSSTGGNALLSQAKDRIAAGSTRAVPNEGSKPSCTPKQGAVAELVVPNLSLVAPIVQGDGDAQLSDAVGHVPTSAWPGGDGTAVFVGHDVTWFHELDHLTQGSEIEYVSGCIAYTYRVQSARVVTKGYPVASTPGHLALVTCWPLDALWFTSQRYLVQAAVVGGAVTTTPVSAPSAPNVPPLAVPPSLVGLDTLSNNPTPLGALTVSGAPSAAFNEGPGPLGDAAAVQDVFFAAQRAARADEAGAWGAIAPSVPASAANPLAGTVISGYGDSLATTIEVMGDRLIGGTVVVQEQLASGAQMLITCAEGIVNGSLAVTGWSTASS